MRSDEVTLFREILGISPSIKVLEYLLEWDGYDLTITDIAREAKIGRANAYEIVNAFEKKAIIKKTRSIGRSDFYMLNKNSPIVESLRKLFNNILKGNIPN